MIFLKGIKIFLKLSFSTIIAFVVLTCFCYFYYNIPAHKMDMDKATDYKWENNKFYSRGTEGFALGKTNNEGYVNEMDYQNQKIETLILGSSHMEAFQLAMSKSTVSLLNEMLKSDAGGGSL